MPISGMLRYRQASANLVVSDGVQRRVTMTISKPKATTQPSAEKSISSNETG